MLLRLAGVFLLCGVTGTFASSYPQIQYYSKEEFLSLAFPDIGEDALHAKRLMLNGQLKQKAQKILTHPYRGRRVTYWMDQDKTAWIIDEIGKEMPMTLGIVVEGDRIKSLNVLVYREERGGEVHNTYFTDQFLNVNLLDNEKLSKDIDGITGATLSVNAITRVARMVLYFHQSVLAGSKDNKTNQFVKNQTN